MNVVRKLAGFSTLFFSVRSCNRLGDIRNVSIYQSCNDMLLQLQRL